MKHILMPKNITSFPRLRWAFLFNLFILVYHRNGTHILIKINQNHAVGSEATSTSVTKPPAAHPCYASNMGLLSKVDLSSVLSSINQSYLPFKVYCRAA